MPFKDAVYLTCCVMNYTEKLLELELLKTSKALEYSKAMAHYNINGQQEITFDGVSELKDEVSGLENLIAVVKKLLTIK